LIKHLEQFEERQEKKGLKLISGLGSEFLF